jgi:hypothetical protein
VGVGGARGQLGKGHTAGVGGVVKPACPHEALGFVKSAYERGVGRMGCPAGAGDGSACARDGGAIGVEGVLEVSVGAVGDRVEVGVLGACALGDGFAGGGDAFGEGELWEGVVGFGSCGV